MKTKLKCIHVSFHLEEGIYVQSTFVNEKGEYIGRRHNSITDALSGAINSLFGVLKLADVYRVIHGQEEDR